MNPLNTEQLLNSLKADMILSREIIKETAFDMIDEGFTHFPIFVAHQLEQEVPIGENLIDHKELGLGWSINVSTLDEFLKKALIKPDREAFFRETYKAPKEHACFFVISEAGGRFVFIPYDMEVPPASHAQ
jgi:hypothetical protein